MTSPPATFERGQLLKDTDTAFYLLLRADIPPPVMSCECVSASPRTWIIVFKHLLIASSLILMGAFISALLETGAAERSNSGHVGGWHQR